MTGINQSSSGSMSPATIATQMATAYTQATQDQLTQQSSNAQATSSALSKLQSALQAFDSTLTTLSAKKGLLQYSAGFDATGFGTATASSTAQTGTYSLFVQQIATANQVAFANLPSVPVASSGTLIVKLAGGSSFNVDFTKADTDGNGTLTQTEIARAINQAASNNGQVNAVLSTVNGQTQLVLAAGNTGASSQITLDTTGLTAGGALQTSLNAGTQLAAAQDAIVWLGPQGTGVQMQQASNTFTNIQGVSMTFTKAMPAGTPALNLTVARDNSATADNVNSFVNAYNALEKVLDGLTSTGSAKDGVAAATFATDAGVRALRSRLNTLVHQQVGGLRLMDYGINMDRNGALSLDQTKLQNKLTANPTGLNTLFGSTGLTASSGVLGSLDTYLNVWMNGSTGQIKQRQGSVQSIQKAVTVRQTRLDNQYSQTYQRYLLQFTRLQTLQSQMSNTTGMLASLG